MKIRNLLVLLCLILTTAASAQVVIRGGDSITGNVSSVSGKRLAILDDRIVFDVSAAKVVDQRGPAKLSDIKKGDRVNARISGSVDGELRASDVLILDDPDASLAGAAEDVNAAAGTVTLLEQQVRVTGSTILRGLDGRPLPSLGAIVRGQHITVDLDAAQSGLVARAITISGSLPFYPTELLGTIDSVHDDLWTIVAENARITVRVTAETVVVGTPRVGDLVFVTFRTGSDGLKVAITIAPGNAAPEPEFPVRGVVAAISETSITLTNPEGGSDSLSANLNGDTIFDNGRPSAGETVTVLMRRITGDVFLVTRVTRETGSSSVSFEGTVSSIGSGEWNIDGRAVGVDAQTKFAGMLAVGDRASVLATTMADGKLLALEIARIARRPSLTTGQ